MVIMGIVFNVVQCNAIDVSNDQKMIVLVSVVAALVVDFFNRSMRIDVPCCSTIALANRRRRRPLTKSILEPNVGSMLVTSSHNPTLTADLPKPLTFERAPSNEKWSTGR